MSEITTTRRGFVNADLNLLFIQVITFAIIAYTSFKGPASAEHGLPLRMLRSGAVGLFPIVVIHALVALWNLASRWREPLAADMRHFAISAGLSIATGVLWYLL